MARRVQTGRKSNTRCMQILAGLIFIIVICIIILYYYIQLNYGTEKTVCSDREATPIGNGVLQKDGSYLDVDTGLVYPVGYHFRVNGTLLGCFCALRPCLRKCCQADEAYRQPPEQAICLKTNETIRPITSLNLTVYQMVQSEMKPVDVPSDHFTMVYGEICQYGKFRLDVENFPESDVNYLMLNGSLFYSNRYYPSTEFCLDTFVGSSALLTVVCFPQEDVTPDSTFQVYSSGMFASLPFLFLTFLVYLILPELQNLHGKNLMCYVFNLFFAYLLLGIIQLSGSRINATCCVVFAFIIQFSFLASFFWLNIMCFDIWWVFSGLKPLNGSEKQREKKKFILYSIYAWGCPTVIFIITLVMQNIEDKSNFLIKPEFGVTKCWFGNDTATFLYFYLPMIILIVLNIIMFITTAIKIAAHKKDSKVLRSGDSRRHNDNERQRFNLYLKLFIVMGVNWVTELISWKTGGPDYLWYVTDLTNTLQGVLIFLIFVWKPRILNLLNKKLCPRWNLVLSTSSTRSKVSPSRTTSLSSKQTSVTNTNPNPPDSISLKKVQSDDSDGQA